MEPGDWVDLIGNRRSCSGVAQESGQLVDGVFFTGGWFVRRLDPGEEYLPVKGGRTGFIGEPEGLYIFLGHAEGPPSGGLYYFGVVPDRRGARVVPRHDASRDLGRDELARLLQSSRVPEKPQGLIDALGLELGKQYTFPSKLCWAVRAGSIRELETDLRFQRGTLVAEIEKDQKYRPENRRGGPYLKGGPLGSSVLIGVSLNGESGVSYYLEYRLSQRGRVPFTKVEEGK
jgi:hypothetical protein